MHAQEIHPDRLSASPWPCSAPPARSENLLEVYQAAVQSDPLIREAEARRMAALEAKPQARGVLLPAGRPSAAMPTRPTRTPRAIQRQFREVSTRHRRAVGGTVSVPYTNTTDTDAFWNYDAQLTQTVFRWDQWQRLKQADSQVALAEAELPRRAAGPDGARVAALLRRARRRRHAHRRARRPLEAVGRQLEQAEKRFEVGLIAITDVQEARAAHDSATAGVIARQARARQSPRSSCARSPARPTRSS